MLPTSAVLPVLCQHHVRWALADEPLPQRQTHVAAASLPELAHMETYTEIHTHTETSSTGGGDGGGGDYNTRTSLSDGGEDGNVPECIGD